VAACYTIVTVAPLGAFLILFDALGWHFGPLFQNLDAAGGTLLSLLLMSLVNVVLALGAWHFVRMSHWPRVMVVIVAVAVAALCIEGVAWHVWLWLRTPQVFQGVDDSVLISGLGGRSLLSVAYVMLAVSLVRTLRALRLPADR
jgi:hypothetical protein